MTGVKPKKKVLKVTTLRFSDAMRERLARRAAEKKKSIGWIVRDLVQKNLPL